MIVATAGHIDHGKTTLVKALTGVDTDRLPEEKRRGVSIDLGFAYWRAAEGATIGFVDVPGHERFVRNMLAGVCAIDHVLLVVAADDGVMPQTREHLAIVDLLGVASASVALTKIDRIAPARLREVMAEVEALLAPTGFARAAVFPVAAPAGDGLGELRAALAARAATLERQCAGGRRARYVIDRAFTVPGSGTVVTGTVLDGAIAEGDRLQLSPSGLVTRVRAVQHDRRSVPRAAAGERCALNLAGVDISDAGRGGWLLDSALHAPTQRLDIRLRLLPEEEAAHWTPVHVHIGTAHVPARVALRRGATLGPGATAHARLVLEQPVAALHGDRFILRDASARRTLGGGVVIDPWPPARRQPPAQRAQQLAAMEKPGAAASLAALAECTPEGVDLDRWQRTRNLDPGSLPGLLADAGLVALGPTLALPRERVQRLHAAIEAAVDRCHREQPQAAGMEALALRRACGESLPLRVFDAVLRALAAVQRVEVASGRVRRPGHVSTRNPADQRMWQMASPALAAAGLRGLTVAQLAADTGLKEMLLHDLLRRQAAGGEVVRVTDDRYYLRSTMAAFAAVAHELVQTLPAGHFGAADYRDRTGLGRQLSIRVLEALDRLGVTLRIGDVRCMRQDFRAVLGAASAPGPVSAPATAAAASRQTRAGLPAHPR